MVWEGQPERVTAPYAKPEGGRAVTPSTTGNVEPCGNLGGPPPKAKYESPTDSAPVP